MSSTTIDAKAKYELLVAQLAAGVEVGAVEVMEVCSRAGRSVADLARDVDAAAGSAEHATDCD